MEDEEMFDVKLIFNEEEVEIQLNSQYDYFLNSICNIISISLEDIKDLSVSYIDSDGDNIVLSGLEDYKIFFQQVSDKLVDSFKVTVKENANIDQNQCLINLLNFKEKLEIRNNNRSINNNNINVNNSINNNINVNNSLNNNINFDNNYKDEENNNMNNYNQDISNNKNSFNYSNIPNDLINSNIINQEYNQNNEINKDINDLIFEYQCSSCKTYPILCKIFYCDKCSFYLCQDCEKNDVKHEHNLLRIDSKEKLREIKEKENAEIDKKQRDKKEKEVKNMMRQYQQNININNNLNNAHNHHNLKIPNSNLEYRNENNRKFYYINSNDNNTNINNNNQHQYQHQHQNYYYNYGNNIYPNNFGYPYYPY